MDEGAILKIVGLNGLAGSIPVPSAKTVRGGTAYAAA